MSCCGSRRAAIEIRPPARPMAAASMQPTASRPRAVAFVYTGATRLVAEGAVTKRRYRFEQTGAVVEIDARDAASFAAIPQLHRHS